MNKAYIYPFNEVYYNANETFEYVLALEKDGVLDIKVSKGNFNIKNLRMYTSDAIHRQYESAKDIRFNKNNDTVTCNIEAKNGEYLVTSIPYDKGFSAQINGEDVEVEIVNKAFIGLKLKEGKNDVVFKYRSPWKNIGFLISIVGVIVFMFILLKDKVLPLMKKYKEIIMYLIFGVMTTIISFVSYYLCTRLFLNPQNPVELQIANIISWILSVSFAYVTNKIFVFKSHGKVGKEMLKFFSSRIGTLLCELALMFVLVTIMRLSDLPVKIAVQFIVIVLNYVLSKLIVFKGDDNK